MQKMRINVMVDKETWDDLRRVLREKGYPRGVPSWLVQQTFERTLVELEHGSQTQLDLFFNRHDLRK